MYGDKSLLDGNFLKALRDYYATSGDRTSKVIDFPPNFPSQFLQGPEYISEGKEGFTIIDSFAGARPFILNHRFLIQKQERVKFLVEIALDSNVASHLHQYVTDCDGKFRNSDRGIATHKLIRRLAEYAERGWQFSSFFYLLEAVSKNKFQLVYPHAQALGQSITTLQLMNDKIFLETGVIKEDAEKYREFSELFPLASIQSASASDVLHFSTGSLVSQTRQIINQSYAALLKTIIIDRQRVTAVKKLEALFGFLHGELGMYLSWEALVACLKFGGHAGGFLSIKKLLASAWDLLLLRLPEILIIGENYDYTTICYVCTAEKTLQKLGKMRTMKTLSSASLRLPPMIQLEIEALGQDVGKELAIKFVELSNNLTLKSFDRKPIPPHMLQLLISDLEKQLYADSTVVE